MKYTVKSKFSIKVAKVLCLVGLMFLVHNVTLGQEITEDNLLEKRREFAFKKRRIIVNNDGLDMMRRKPEDNAADFLSKRTEGLEGKQVDAISYCTGVFDSYTHKSSFSELKTVNKEGKEFMSMDLINQGTDALQEMINYCRKNQMDIFWSFRMNDTHDSGEGAHVTKWKMDNQNLLLGTEGKKFEYGGSAWAALNYEERAVRNRVFSIIEEVVTNYDVDGVELDFFKHLIYFKEPTTGVPASQMQQDMMTELIRDIRIMLNKYSIIRQKPILLLIKIPDSPEYAKVLGLDYITWMEKNYVDVYISGDYFKFRPWTDIVNMNSKYNVATFACLEPRRVHGGGRPGERSDLPKWRGEAYNAWKAGVNGIYTFNRFQTWDKIFVEIGDPKKLERLERVDQESYICGSCWFKPQKWVKDGEQYLKDQN